MNMEIRVTGTQEEIMAFLNGRNVEVQVEKKTKAPKIEEVRAAEPKVETPKVEEAPATVVEEAPVTEEAPATVEATATKEMIRALATELVKANKQAQVNEVIKATGAASISKLADEHLDSVYSQLTALKG